MTGGSRPEWCESMGRRGGRSVGLEVQIRGSLGRRKGYDEHATANRGERRQDREYQEVFVTIVFVQSSLDARLEIGRVGKGGSGSSAFWFEPGYSAHCMILGEGLRKEDLEKRKQDVQHPCRRVGRV